MQQGISNSDACDGRRPCGCRQPRRECLTSERRRQCAHPASGPFARGAIVVQPRRRRHRRDSRAAPRSVIGVAARRRVAWRRPSASTTLKASERSPWRRAASPRFVLALHAFGFARHTEPATAWVVAALPRSSPAPPCAGGWRPRAATGALARCLERRRRRHRHLGSSGATSSPSIIRLAAIIKAAGLRHPAAARRRARSAVPPAPVVVAGLAAVAGWSLLICWAVFTDGVAAVTADYRTYLVLVPHPARRRRRCASLRWPASSPCWPSAPTAPAKMLGRAAHASDYSEALEAARQHLDRIRACSRAGRERPWRRSIVATPS